MLLYSRLKGVKQSFDAYGRIGALAMTEDYASVLGESNEIGGEEGAYMLLTFDMEKGKTENYKTAKLLYELTEALGSTVRVLTGHLCPMMWIWGPEN